MLDDDVEREDGWFTNEDKSLVFTIYQAGTTRAQIDAGAGTPQDVTGFAVSYMLKQDPDDPDALAVVYKTTSIGGVALTTPGSGIITVTIGDSDTEALTPGEYWQELKRVGAGVDIVLSQGRVLLRRSLHHT